MDTVATRRAPIGAILMIVGGALATIGSFLTWANVRASDVSASAKGTDGSDGYITLAGGVLLIGAGIAVLRSGRRGMAILAIVAGLLAGGVGIYDAMTAEDNVLDAVAEQLAPQVGATVEQVRAVLQGEADSGNLDIKLAVGLYLVIGGGVIGALGGLLGLATAKRDALSAAPVIPGGAVTPSMMTGGYPTTPSAVSPPSAAPPPPPPVEPPTP